MEESTFENIVRNKTWNLSYQKNSSNFRDALEKLGIQTTCEHFYIFSVANLIG